MQQDTDFVSVHKHAKKELGQYPILTSRLVSKARFMRRISAVSDSIQRIKFDRNSTFAFLRHIRLVLLHYRQKCDTDSNVDFFWPCLI